MKGSKIPRTELNTVHLYQHYSLYIPNKLQYTWRGDYCKCACVQPTHLPVLGRGYIEARTETTQQFGQTPEKEVKINP